MADVGRCDYKKDILPKNESVIDMIRVATYIHQIPTAIEMIEDFKQKGYEVTVNIMAVSKVNNDDLDAGLELLANSSVDVIYLVDSFGHFYPEQITKLSQKYVKIAEEHGKIVGIHAHNNQQLAFANTIECIRNGVCLLDATVSGMGRGAGNCFMESLLCFLKNPKYNVRPIIQFVEKHILKLKAEGAVWGYDIPYLLTGILNSHPSSAIKFIKENRTDYNAFMQELMEMYNERDLMFPATVIDANHNNSGKKYEQQVRIVKEVLHSRKLNSDIHRLVKGVMIESYIVEGCQKIGDGVYGKSITDPCLGWEESERLIYDIAENC